MRILGTIAAASALLTACGQTREDPPADMPANRSDSPAERNESLSSPGGEAGSQGDAPVAETRAAENNTVRPDPVASPASADANPCMVQDDKVLSVAAVRAIGTEPFWNARVEGRCVTYSHPEDQKGTRVWTSFAPGPAGGSWSGKLNGGRFELRIRPQRNCSDGMSDKSYPLAAELIVGGERRQGCAEPA